MSRKKITRKIKERRGVTMDRIVGYAEHDLDTPYYIPTEKDKEPLYRKIDEIEMIDPRFYIDHLYIDHNGDLTQHPYITSMGDLKRLIEFCEESGLAFHVSGHSEYFPGSAFKIIFHRADQALRPEERKRISTEGA